MLLSLLLGNKAIFLCLFLFLSIAFKNILRISILTRLKLALALPIDALMTVSNEEIKSPLLTLDKTSKFCNEKKTLILLNLNFRII